MPDVSASAQHPGNTVPIRIQFARLVRLPNVFSAPPDVIAGVAVATGSFQFSGTLALVLAGSCLLYAAGMIWNDYFDFATDARERPTRPIPSGAISRSSACLFGMIAMLLGIGLCFIASWKTGLVSIFLAIAILLYDGALKRLPVAPAVMGLCRSLNLILGVVVARHMLGISDSPDWGVYVALANGIYITGVTLFARREAGISPRSFLISGAGLMTVALLTHMAIWGFAGQIDLLGALLLLGFALFLSLRAIPAISEPGPQTIQRAVKTAVLGIIVINAATSATFAGPLPALIVLAHLVPALWIGRWIYST